MSSLINFFLFLCILISFINCIYIFPFEKINTANQNDKEETIIDDLTNNTVRVKIKVGTPPQDLLLHVSTESVNTYIIAEDATIFENEEKYKVFNSSKSQTYNFVNDGEVFNEGYIEGNSINETIVLDNKKHENFHLLEGKMFYPGFGLSGDGGVFGIGIKKEYSLYSQSFSIVEQLKKLKAFESYDTFIHYTGKGKGIIGIGETLKNYDNNFKDIKYIERKFPKEQEVMIGFDIKEITYNNNIINVGITQSKLSLDRNIIQANEKLKNILDKDVFGELLQKGLCINITKRDKEFSKIMYYHCKKGSIDKQKLYSLKFKIYEFESVFEINLKDLLIDFGERTYFLMSFLVDEPKAKKSTIILGEPFISKYSFSFNRETQLVELYDTSKKISPEKNSKNMTIPIIIICVAIIIIAILSFFLYKMWKNFPKRKRANELDDDLFDYSTKNK